MEKLEQKRWTNSKEACHIFDCSHSPLAASPSLLLEFLISKVHAFNVAVN
ncbi:uncharacterized protein PHALS_00264 [Plasmopara halstedii]|uniref:Uncharacterized protein n=1 Tax=Plasmopara halstedii TaxID=4781 RepID=A0A0P1A6X7_PLAHL|nr:uncharacterized protein PHALS_00264 [Plasmopara halstedii]CEG35940.1 hypothetical protein PHALS_00264 [Plasmopara halstedii]|eukprot:XP_024572309.1 hypothetical protein PHALS_00264 [Plasmopara halstedii]